MQINSYRQLQETVRSAILEDLKEIRVLIQSSNGTMSQQTLRPCFICWLMDKRQCNLFSSIFLKVCAHKNHEKLERLTYWNFKYILHNLVCTKIQVKYKHKAIMIILCKSILWYSVIYKKVQLCLICEKINTRLNHYWQRALKSTL